MTILHKAVLATFAAMVLTASGANAAATLYGVTGDGASPGETLYTLSQADATATFFMSLGAGNDGEAIAYNPDDGLMYHASGYFGGETWESINLDTAAVLTSVNIGDGCSSICEITALTYNAATGTFLASDLNSNHLSIATDGSVTNLGFGPETLKGLAFKDGTLYGIARSGAELYTLDPLTGSVLTTTVLSYSGGGISGFNGLALNPDTGALWTVLRSGGRHLATIDLGSGTVSTVGSLFTSFAGIAFTGEGTPLPGPGAMALLGIGLLGLAMRRWVA